MDFLEIFSVAPKVNFSRIFVEELKVSFKHIESFGKFLGIFLLRPTWIFEEYFWETDAHF